MHVLRRTSKSISPPPYFLEKDTRKEQLYASPKIPKKVFAHIEHERNIIDPNLLESDLPVVIVGVEPTLLTKFLLGIQQTDNRNKPIYL